MSILHCFTDLGEHLKAVIHAQSVQVAVIINRAAFHVVHYEEGQSFGGTSAIEELDNIGMIEAGKSLALVAETVQEVMAVQTRLYQLDCHQLAVFVIGPRRKKNGRHTT